MVGWGNYFSSGTVQKAYCKVDRHAYKRLRRWLCAKHKHKGGGTTRFPHEYLVQELGLVQLVQRRRALACAKA